MAKTNLITREGYQQLQQEHDYLWHEKRPEITKIVTWAVSWATALKMPIINLINVFYDKSIAEFVICASVCLTLKLLTTTHNKLAKYFLVLGRN